MGADFSALFSTKDGKNIRHVYSTGDVYVGDFRKDREAARVSTPLFKATDMKASGRMTSDMALVP